MKFVGGTPKGDFHPDECNGGKNELLRRIQ